ncbi:uncharacterized protein P174DRAFT_498773 [Aspergillus novofumigatus IBT 16806]|uniref:Uncharacterized protein n=1 Tax=Aspergillus novofumigatus (strain IBT 16806) TaxID=1392255 RepID=A0A2I1BWX7_ASPN1|nr:uncharacterized protein P174DRAFT_498773 [Aspergillus novofumigatus IBT 16806]PKX89878.1 hypothetical protein P174DRAFT_498773 [Aspergillus novofumigatus IBT 16806]
MMRMVACIMNWFPVGDFSGHCVSRVLVDDAVVPSQGVLSSNSLPRVYLGCNGNICSMGIQPSVQIHGLHEAVYFSYGSSGVSWSPGKWPVDTRILPTARRAHDDVQFPRLESCGDGFWRPDLASGSDHEVLLYYERYHGLAADYLGGSKQRTAHRVSVTVNRAVKPSLDFSAQAECYHINGGSADLYASGARLVVVSRSISPAPSTKLSSKPIW